MTSQQPFTVQPQSSAPPITIDLQARLFTMHPVSTQEIDDLRFNSPAFAIAFFGIAFGAAISLAGVVFSTPLPTNPHATFFALFVAAVVLAVFFGAWTGWGFWTTGRLVKEIKKRPPTV